MITIGDTNILEETSLEISKLPSLKNDTKKLI